MDIPKVLIKEFGVGAQYLNNTIQLIDEGNTIPFIARYRKELTGSMDDQLLRELYERLVYLRNLDEKREQVRRLIDEQGKLDEEVAKRLTAAATVTEIDDIYRPFRPKRRTRATIAKEKGLEPLALLIWEHKLACAPQTAAADYVCEEVSGAEEALDGAKDIIAELIADDADFRARIRKLSFDKALLDVKGDAKKESVYEMYYDYHELVKKIAGHRVLAINRGEKEDFLKVSLETPAEEIIELIYKRLYKGNTFTKDILREALEDAYKRLIAPSIEREIRNEITEKAEDGAVKVFSENLKQLLLQPPVKDKTVLALDPGFRTGCKVSCIDGTGKVLETGVIYPTKPQEKTEEAKKKLKPIIEKHHVDIIAIGNGTASRETELFVVDMLKEIPRKVLYCIVNEAGASVYSASKLGAEEFPDYDVALRSAVSIGRRLQDPLAELVKIDPRSIGVGQYQHDINQKRLGESLGGVVESCVNSVGVDLNTASPALLSYVAGLSSAVSKNILEYRETNGKFKNRKELLKVKKLGPKAFEQCAGFLRIRDGNNPMDNTGVHPESYTAAENVMSYVKNQGGSLTEFKTDTAKVKELAEKLQIGLPTLLDIITELEKPGRDPRDAMEAPILRSDVLSMEDLTPGMMLKGTVRNVIDFGVFVDIGVHQDGLVHVSELANRFVKHPLEVVSVGDIVDVAVISVDANKKRISLSMKAAAKGK